MIKEKDYKNLLIIGGTGRNVGKTEFICQLIQKYKHLNIIAVKVSNVLPAEIDKHGNHSGLSPEKHFIFEEKNPCGKKDTSRMLRAGAQKVYYCQTNEKNTEKIIPFINSLIENGQVIISESNFLHKKMEKSPFIMIHNPEKAIKQRALSSLHKASLVIYSNGKDSFRIPGQTKYLQGKGWVIKQD